MPRYTGSTTPPTTSVPFDSKTLLSGLADRVTGVVFCDVGGTLYIEQSINNGKNWDLQKSIVVAANTGVGFSEELVAPWYRIRFVPTNDASAAFRISSRLSSAGPR